MQPPFPHRLPLIAAARRGPTRERLCEFPVVRHRAPLRYAACCGLVLALWMGLGGRAQAAGSDLSLRTTDGLEVLVDYRWAGNAYGGYYPVRFQVRNDGEERTLRFEIEERRGRLPQVARDVTIEAQTSLDFTLPVPMVGPGTHVTLTVYDDGEEIPEMVTGLALPAPDRSGLQRPSLLVISPVLEDCREFEKAATAIIAENSSRRHRHGGFGARSNDHQVLAPNMLPDSWIDYTGLDFVAIPLDVLEQLPVSNRTAILEWMEAGGNLIVYATDAEPPQSDRLAQILDLSQRGLVSPEWQPSQETQRDVTRQRYESQLLVAEATVTAGGSAAGRVGRTPNMASLMNLNEGAWDRSAPAFWDRGILLGRVIAFRQNPFPGSSLDWCWMLNALGSPRWNWIERHGVAARAGNRDFPDFSIPGVQSVPVFSFLFLITVFTIIIGPVNYFLLWRKKQLHLLIVTIPIIAFATSVSMFAYSVMAHGFGVKSRVRSVTLLDQQQQTAVTVARQAMHAGVTPSSGLLFDRDVAVFPIWPVEAEFEGGAVDWTDAQALRAGWLRSRTRTQMLNLSHRRVRGRLEIETGTAGASVANGLEWDLDYLVIIDEAGRAFVTENLAAGDKVPLRPFTESDMLTYTRLITANAPEMPAGLEERGPRMRLSGPFGRRISDLTDASMEAGLLETAYRQAQWFRTGENGRLAATDVLRNPQRSYVGLVRDNPGIEYGTPTTGSDIDQHLLIGAY